MIHVVAFMWGQKYGVEYVDRLAAGLRRQMRHRFRFVVVAENPETRRLKVQTIPIPKQDMPLLTVPGCFARLRLFDPVWQEQNHFYEGDKILSLDLDLIITGSLRPLLEQIGDATFKILQDVNTSNPCPYNGSVWMLRAGTHRNVWYDFSLAAARKVPFFEFPDDQGWFAAKIPDAGAWTAKSGVYAFQKRGWPLGNELPPNAAIVAFPGSRDPSKFTHLPWVQKHWLTK